MLTLVNYKRNQIDSESVTSLVTVQMKKLVEQSKQLSCPTTKIQAEATTLPHLIDKAADIAITNKDAGLVIAAALGTSVILYVVADAAAKLIKALRSSNQA